MGRLCEVWPVAAAAAAVGALPGVAATCAVLLSSVLGTRPSCLMNDCSSRRRCRKFLKIADR
jgi:hypothetical protein